MKSWQISLQVLKDGNQRFIQQKMNHVLHHNLQDLVEGQHPYAVVLCCSDSRVSPDIIFDCSLGDIFIIQNAGNVCDTSVMGSIQYAIQFLETPLVVILGHSDCGAVTAAHGHQVMKGPLQSIVSFIDGHIVEGNVIDSIENHTRKTAGIIQTALDQHQDKIIQNVKVLAALYHLDTGEIQWENIETESF